MAQILYRINSSINSDNYVLKGGTGLLFCYGLDRFSEDIDLDGIRKVKLDKEIQSACNDLGKYSVIRVTKETDTVLRYMIDYGSVRKESYPLKLEISFRNRSSLLKKLSKIEVVNGFRIYSLETLINMKYVAFLNRDKARDFYDLYWCLKSNPDIIDKRLAGQLLEGLNYKGVDILVDMLKEEVLRDHILRDMDPETVMLEFMSLLEERVLDEGTEPMQLF